MAERAANKEYKRALEKVDEEIEGKLFVGYKIPGGRVRYFIYPFGDLSEFKREMQDKTSFSQNIVSYGIIRIQETEKGKIIKLEDLDLDKVPLETEDDKRVKRIIEKIEKSRQK